MTIAIGLIPNEHTVMLIQDSEISYMSLGFTQDIFNKIKTINDKSIAGIIGNPLFANELIEVVSTRTYESSAELRTALEDAYHGIREQKLIRGVLRKFGFNHPREIFQPAAGTTIEPAVKEEVFRAVHDAQGFGLTVMLASYLATPQLYTVSYPGVGFLQSCPKMYQVSGSGSIMAIDKMGEELERYRWQSSLTIEEGISVLMRAGKASEKHEGVGGPFDIAYLTKKEQGEIKIQRPDQRKINMVMYLFPLNIDQKVLLGAIEQMRDESVKDTDLAQFIKSKIGVGIEFDRYFGFNNNGTQ